MIIKDWKKDVLTIPNFLSLFRLALIPVYITRYLHAQTEKDYLIAAAILAISCLTDLLDGIIARKCNMISNLGKILDPIADKATQLALLLSLTIRYPVLWYLVALFVVKEGFQMVAGILLLRKNKILKGAHMAGKICTTVLFLSFLILLLRPGLSRETVSAITVVDAAFLVVSFANYIRIFCGKGGQFQDI
ncbi:MAG: CDP-alcohol phosphatidyltransferase family protein [Firmicutes bacterium]|nr:CDP-alcohol phosphatidyltransferase family protein [Bacillota bacterium]